MRERRARARFRSRWLVLLRIRNDTTEVTARTVYTDPQVTARTVYTDPQMTARTVYTDPQTTARTPCSQPQTRPDARRPHPDTHNTDTSAHANTNTNKRKDKHTQATTITSEWTETASDFPSALSQPLRRTSTPGTASFYQDPVVDTGLRYRSRCSQEGGSRRGMGIGYAARLSAVLVAVSVLSGADGSVLLVHGARVVSLGTNVSVGLVYGASVTSVLREGYRGQ
eukprot:3167533-Rhodomonas_salina.2